MVSDLTDRLRAFDVTGGLSDDELEALSRNVFPTRAVAGDVLVDEGQAGFEFVLIERGTCSVTVRGEIVRVLEAGDYFGEIALLEGGQRTARVTAASPCELLTLTAEGFAQLTDGHPDLVDKLMAVARERLDGDPA